MHGRVGSQQRLGVSDMPAELGIGPFHTVQRHERALAAGRVLAGRLAHGCGIRGQVENVVGELEGKADLFAEGAQPAAVLLRASCDDGAGLAGKADQRARFHRLQADDAGLVWSLFFRREIERLAASHAAETGARASARTSDALLASGSADSGAATMSKA